MVYSSGSIEVLKIEKSVTLHATKPPCGANCIAWSPKGKQMVVGFNDGSLKQFTAELVEKKATAPCPLLEAGSKCQVGFLIFTHQQNCQ